MVNAIKCLRRGGKLIAFGLPKNQAFTFDNYSGDVIFNGLTVQGIIGRRIYDTWYKVRELVRNPKAQALLRKVISEVVPFEDYPRVFEKMLAGKASKCVLDWGKA